MSNRPVELAVNSLNDAEYDTYTKLIVELADESHDAAASRTSCCTDKEDEEGAATATASVTVSLPWM